MAIHPGDNETDEQRLARLSRNAKHQREFYARKVPVMKAEIFDAIGRTCAHCGYADERALEIDHIHGGGSQQRKLGGGAYGYYKRISDAIRAGSKDFRCLCRNCNWIAHLDSQPVKVIPAAPRPVGRPKGAKTQFTHNHCSKVA